MFVAPNADPRRRLASVLHDGGRDETVLTSEARASVALGGEASLVDAYLVELYTSVSKAFNANRATPSCGDLSLDCSAMMK